MVYLIVFGFIILLVCGIVKFAAGKDYEDMTEEQFEAEKDRATLLSGPILELQEIIDAGHRVEYVQQQKEERAGGQESGDPPDTEKPPLT